jgi:hypothetical protein
MDTFALQANAVPSARIMGVVLLEQQFASHKSSLLRFDGMERGLAGRLEPRVSLPHSTPIVVRS